MCGIAAKPPVNRPLSVKPLDNRPQTLALTLMNKLVLLLFRVVLLGSALWACTACLAEDRIGTLKKVDGQVELEHAGASAPAQSGAGLQAGDRLRTTATGAVSVTLRDGTQMVLGPNSTLEFTRFQFDSTTEDGDFAALLIKGSLRLISGLIAKVNPNKYQIHTPTTVISVRGTDFIVEVSP